MVFISYYLIFLSNVLVAAMVFFKYESLLVLFKGMDLTSVLITFFISLIATISAYVINQLAVKNLKEYMGSKIVVHFFACFPAVTFCWLVIYVLERILGAA